MKFKERLKQKRIELNITQDTLAKHLHVSRQAVSNWERGISEPDLDTLQKISECLNWPVSEMLNQTEHKPKPNWKKIIILSILCLVAVMIHLFIFPAIKEYASKTYRIEWFLMYTYWLKPIFYLFSGMLLSSFYEHRIPLLPKVYSLLCVPICIYYFLTVCFFLPFRPAIVTQIMFWIFENVSNIYILMILEGMILNLTIQNRTHA